jgi:hypothetical protein
MTRGVLYITWPGEGRMPAMLARSRESLAKVHPELPVHVAELPDGSTLLDKARMYDLSPFDQTLFLDADTVVMGNLDYGFEKAESAWHCPVRLRVPVGQTVRGPEGLRRHR